MKRAIHECQLQFKNEKWDCKVLGTKDGIIPFKSAFLNRGKLKWTKLEVMYDAERKYVLLSIINLNKT